MLYLKGAPERVLKLCSTIFDGSSAIPLTEEHKAQFQKTYEFMASKGHRVLAFAGLALPKAEFPADFEFKKVPANYPTTDLTFYGLVSLEDPPKHGVREAVGHCREAGIKVMMVTGDHPLTAEAIGRKINLMLQDTKEKLAEKRKVPVSQVPEADVKAIVIHGEKVDSLTDADWDNIFSKEEIIFARTSPKHKLTIVKYAQSLGHIVGVTGDGVNDSPALKKADLGIAMNQSGSDVSKEAAAMILVDDNFASTVNGIEEGRLIFQNLKKSIQYTVTHTMPQVYANLLSIIVPLPLPLSNVLILLTDLGFELIVAVSYVWDLPESKTGLMKLRPRKPVTPESIERTKRDNSDTKPSMFSSEYWSRKFEHKDEEVLVDGNLLRWSYFEAGTIMTIGCLVSYFFAMWYEFKVTPNDAFKHAKSFNYPEGNITISNGDVLVQFFYASNV
jgi:sodium/potassium-transporting ATPase subunit alpha